MKNIREIISLITKSNLLMMNCTEEDEISDLIISNIEAKAFDYAKSDEVFTNENNKNKMILLTGFINNTIVSELQELSSQIAKEIMKDKKLLNSIYGILKMNNTTQYEDKFFPIKGFSKYDVNLAIEQLKKAKPENILDNMIMYYVVNKDKNEEAGYGGLKKFFNLTEQLYKDDDKDK